MGLAARGLRDLDGGPERIEDQALRQALRRRAQTVKVGALLVGGALTALACWP